MTATAVQQSPSYALLLRRNRNYAALWLGQLVSVFGDRLHQVALLVLVGSLTSNNLGQIALVFVVLGAPSLLFGLSAGALVDRWDRRRVMLAADLVRVPMVVSIPFLARVDLLWVYVMAFLLTSVGLFFKPAKDAIIPNIVSEEDGLMKANSLSSATDTLVDVLGYPLAGALVAGLWGFLAEGHGIELAFYVDAVTYGFSALMIYRISASRTRTRTEHTEAAAFGGLGRAVLGGLRFVRSSAVLFTNTAIVTVAVLLFWGSYTLTYGYATEVSDTGAFGYSLLEAALGLGATVGGLAVGRWGERFRMGPTILLGLVVMGATETSLAFFANLWFAAGVVALGGAANMLFVIPSITLVQQLTPDEFRGRVSGLRTTLFCVAGLASNALVGPAAERFGVQSTWAITGMLLMVLGLLSFFLPSARKAD
jgi:DHA3 family macrolide efflux protein-like MFS transporter